MSHQREGEAPSEPKSKKLPPSHHHRSLLRKSGSAGASPSQNQSLTERLSVSATSDRTRLGNKRVEDHERFDLLLSFSSTIGL